MNFWTVHPILQSIDRERWHMPVEYFMHSKSVKYCRGLGIMTTAHSYMGRSIVTSCYEYIPIKFSEDKPLRLPNFQFRICPDGITIISIQFSEFSLGIMIYIFSVLLSRKKWGKNSHDSHYKYHDRTRSPTVGHRRRNTPFICDWISSVLHCHLGQRWGIEHFINTTAA